MFTGVFAMTFKRRFVLILLSDSDSYGIFNSFEILICFFFHSSGPWTIYNGDSNNDNRNVENE